MTLHALRRLDSNEYRLINKNSGVRCGCSSPASDMHEVYVRNYVVWLLTSLELLPQLFVLVHVCLGLPVSICHHKGCERKPKHLNRCETSFVAAFSVLTWRNPSLLVKKKCERCLENDVLFLLAPIWPKSKVKLSRGVQCSGKN